MSAAQPDPRIWAALATQLQGQRGVIPNQTMFPASAGDTGRFGRVCATPGRIL